MSTDRELQEAQARIEQLEQGYDVLTHFAYQYADAMLKAREG